MLDSAYTNIAPYFETYMDSIGSVNLNMALDLLHHNRVISETMYFVNTIVLTKINNL